MSDLTPWEQSYQRALAANYGAQLSERLDQAIEQSKGRHAMTMIHHRRNGQGKASVMALIEQAETQRALDEAIEDGTKGVLVRRNVVAGLTQITVTDAVAPGMVHYETITTPTPLKGVRA